MKFKVNFISDAEDDLFNIYKYVWINDSEEKADKLYAQLQERCSALQEFASRGHIPPELKLLEIEDFLEVHFNPYRIIYQIVKNKVFIHCILDGRRDMQKLLQERLLNK